MIAALLAAALVASATLPAIDDATRVARRINEIRTERHLVSLRPSEELAGVARAHAEDMVRRGYFAHVDPDGVDPLERARAAGLDGFRLLAENIGASSVSHDRVEAVVAGWLESPIHRENVLNPAFNATGVGMARAPDGRTLFVQLFASYERLTPPR